MRGRVKLASAAGAGLVLTLGVAALPSRKGETRSAPEARVSTGTFVEGPLAAVLGKAAVSDPDSLAAVSAMRGILDPRRLQDRDGYSLTVSTAGDLERLTIFRGLKEYRVSRGGTGGFRGEVVDSPQDAVRDGAGGEVRSFLWESFIGGGLSPDLAVTFADIFAWKIDFLTECQAGDRFALVWEERRTRDGRLAGREILAAGYDGRVTGRKLAFLFEGLYYDEKGESLASAFLRAPLQYRRISSYFTKRRYHPILRIFRPHNAIDYAAPSGTPVSSVADGRVTFAGWKGGYGKFVEIRHANGYVTGYGHLSRIARGVSPGARVSQGQVIGAVGRTGLATGPHLDFSIKENGRFRNYLSLRFQSREAVPGARRRDFHGVAGELLPELKALLSPLHAGRADRRGENLL